ncbi:hypothetical protein QT995_18585 [Microcoleus sp. S36b_A3]|uniref:hypothetical protein n=1 Tax=unclassified Microcoleus TaxID=2642155 RepID=UPI002FD0F3AC
MHYRESSVITKKEEGRRKKAEGRRQKAEGRRQKAEGRRKKKAHTTSFLIARILLN